MNSPGLSAQSEVEIRTEQGTEVLDVMASFGKEVVDRVHIYIFEFYYI